MKPRIQGSKAQLIFLPETTGVAPLELGEIDDFSATQKSEVVQRRPMGYSIHSTTYKYSGWDVSFSGGKVDWKLARWAFITDRASRVPGRTTGFNVLQTFEHYDGTLEQYVYTNLILFGLEQKLKGGDDITEEIRGYCPKREIGPIDTAILSLDGVAWNAIATTAATTDIASAVGGILPPEVRQAISIVRSRPF